MTGSVHSKPGSFDIKRDVEYEEVAPVRDEILERYPLIKDKTPEERAAIEKSLVRKLDWKFLPMVTAMLLMKSVILSLPIFLLLTDAAILIELTSPTLDSQACRKIFT